MARTISLVFGGEERPFRLALGEVQELQDKCGVGPATIFARLFAFQPQAADVKRPNPDDFAEGEIDPDYQAHMNVFATLRQIGGDWRINDIREPIRLGLIGAGMSPTDAWVLVTRYVDQFPLTENIGTACAVLMHLLVGNADDPVGKVVAGMTTPEAAPTA